MMKLLESRRKKKRNKSNLRMKMKTKRNNSLLLIMLPPRVNLHLNWLLTMQVRELALLKSMVKMPLFLHVTILTTTSDQSSCRCGKTLLAIISLRCAKFSETFV